MPTYEYQCTACGHKFEKFHSITAAPIKDCPECKKKKVKRLIGTGAGLIFKGSGFYITDYRSDGYKSAAKSDSGSSSSSSSTSASSTTASTSAAPATSSASSPTTSPSSASASPKPASKSSK